MLRLLYAYYWRSFFCSWNRSRFSWNRDTFDTLLRWFLRCNATEPFAFEYLSVQCAPLAWFAVLDTPSHSLERRRVSNGILAPHFSKRTLWNLLCTCIHGVQTISGDYHNTCYCGSYQKAEYPKPKVSQSSIYRRRKFRHPLFRLLCIREQNFHSFTASFPRCSNVSGSFQRSKQSSDSAAGAAGALCCFIRSLRTGRTASSVSLASCIFLRCALFVSSLPCFSLEPTDKNTDFVRKK